MTRAAPGIAILSAGLISATCGRPAVVPPDAAPRARARDAVAAAASADASEVATPPAAGRPRGKQLVVLYSSNLRGEYDGHPLGGLARRATVVAQLRAEADGILQVDAGDTVLPQLLAAPHEGRVPPEPAEVERRARLVLAALGAAGLDAFTPGERDLALGPARLARLARAARVPVVASNVVDGRGRPWFAVDRLVTIGGLAVGIFGLVTAATPDGLAALGVTLTDPVQAGTRAVASLRERGARLVIALLHPGGGRAEARTLVRAVPGIHLAVLGHGGETLERPPIEGKTWLVEAGERGTYLGRLDLHLLGAGGDHDDLEPLFASGGAEAGWLAAEIVRLDETFARHPRVRTLVSRYVDESRRRTSAGRSVGPGPQQPPPPPAGRSTAPPSPREDWTYASTAGCKFCHEEEVAQWQTTAHAYALETLMGRARQRDVECLGCHTTGFERPGGTRQLTTATTYFAGVGCESCHGPSVRHLRAQNRTGTRREVPEPVCLECHRPDKSLAPFEYRSALQRVLGPGHGVP